MKNENEIIELKNTQNEIRELEQFYNTGKVDNILENIEKEKEKVVQEMIKFAKEHEQAVKFDRDGDVIQWGVVTRPIVITNLFFKSIVPISCQEPQYNAEKLGMVFDYYNFLVAKVNDEITSYPSSLKNFCHFAGITTTTLRNYKNSDDLAMRTLVEKIYDYIEDDNVSLSQLGMAKEKTTIFKMKTQNEVVEKEQPKVNINITEKPDMDRINERINAYKVFAEKSGK